MPRYCLRHRHRTVPNWEFDAVDDVEALQFARRYANGSDYALRCGERCVALLPHDEAAVLVSTLCDFPSSGRTAARPVI
jgi:hypothetical protein